MRRKQVGIAVILFGWLVLAMAPVPSPAMPQSRDKTTKAVREAIFKTMKAFLTGDVKTLKLQSTQRTLDLVNLVYQAAREDPRLSDELRNARITNAEEFLGFFMQGMANQYLLAAPMPPEQAARRVANDANVSFAGKSEARILMGDSEFARAKLVAGMWKIDLTDSLKKAVLKEVKNPEIRNKIKSL